MALRGERRRRVVAVAVWRHRRCKVSCSIGATRGTVQGCARSDVGVRVGLGTDGPPARRSCVWPWGRDVEPEPHRGPGLGGLEQQHRGEAPEATL